MLDLYVEYRMCSYACGFLLWVECSTQVRQLIVLYGETITGHLLNKWQRKCILPIVSWFFIKTYMTCTPFFYLDFSGCCQANCEYYWIRDKNSKKRLLYVWLFLCVCVWYLWDEREKVFVVGKLQMFGEETMQPGDFCLVPLSFLVVHVLHVCRRRRRDVHDESDTSRSKVKKQNHACVFKVNYSRDWMSSMSKIFSETHLSFCVLCRKWARLTENKPQRAPGKKTQCRLVTVQPSWRGSGRPGEKSPTGTSSPWTPSWQSTPACAWPSPLSTHRHTAAVVKEINSERQYEVRFTFTRIVTVLLPLPESPTWHFALQ